MFAVADLSVALGAEDDMRPASAWLASMDAILLEDPVTFGHSQFAIKAMLPTAIALSFGKKCRRVVDGFQVEGRRIDQRLVLVRNPGSCKSATTYVGLANSGSDPHALPRATFTDQSAASYPDGMSPWVAACWFVSAYSPLLILLAVKEIALGERLLALGMVGLAILGAIVAWLALLDRFTPSSNSYPIHGIDHFDPSLGTYLATFVLPFVAITGATGTDILALLGFFALLGYLLVHSRTLLPNPALAVLGYQWRLITLANGQQRQVLIPPKYPLVQHTNPAVAIGPSNANEPRLEMCQLTGAVWLAKRVA